MGLNDTKTIARKWLRNNEDERMDYEDVCGKVFGINTIVSKEKKSSNRISTLENCHKARKNSSSPNTLNFSMLIALVNKNLMCTKRKSLKLQRIKRNFKGLE